MFVFATLFLLVVIFFTLFICLVFFFSIFVIFVVISPSLLRLRRNLRCRLIPASVSSSSSSSFTFSFVFLILLLASSLSFSSSLSPLSSSSYTYNAPGHLHVCLTILASFAYIFFSRCPDSGTHSKASFRRICFSIANE